MSGYAFGIAVGLFVAAILRIPDRSEGARFALAFVVVVLGLLIGTAGNLLGQALYWRYIAP